MLQIRKIFFLFFFISDKIIVWFPFYSNKRLKILNIIFNLKP